MDKPTPEPAPKFTEADRQEMAYCAHDIAVLVAAGMTPRQDRVDRFRELIAKRDAWLAHAD